MKLTPVERMMTVAKVQLILHKAKQEKSVCQWCFEAPALNGKTMCQACIDAWDKEDDDFDLDRWLEEEDVNREAITEDK